MPVLTIVNIDNALRSPYNPVAAALNHTERNITFFFAGSVCGKDDLNCTEKPGLARAAIRYAGGVRPR